MDRKKNYFIRRIGLCIFAVAVSVILSGCHQIVHVEDMQGNSVAGAQVSTQMSRGSGGSGKGPAGVTNRFGNAMLKKPAYDNPPLWITVQKFGYRTTGVEYVANDRMVIQIQRIIAE